MLWIRLKPIKLQRKCSCIIIAYIYHPPGADNGSLREYMKTSLDTVLRRSSECGVILSGYFNQFNDSVLCTHYGYEQLVKTTTLNRAIFAKCGLKCHPCTVVRQCLTEWEHQTRRWCYWSHPFSQYLTRA